MESQIPVACCCNFPDAKSKRENCYYAYSVVLGLELGELLLQRRLARLLVFILTFQIFHVLLELLPQFGPLSLQIDARLLLNTTYSKRDISLFKKKRITSIASVFFCLNNLRIRKILCALLPQHLVSAQKLLKKILQKALPSPTMALSLSISSWYSLSRASLGSSLILGLFLMFLARLA